jgi:RNA polymerase sigma-70 factor (ECF subfamily)
MRSEQQLLSAYEAIRVAHADADVEPALAPVPKAAAPTTAEDHARLRKMVDSHYDAVWRTVRFLGVPDASAEDAAQQVFCVAMRKLETIPVGAELRFLLGIAWRVASEFRRAARRRPPPGSGEEVDDFAGSLPSPEQMVDQKQARAVLRAVLDAMPVDLRTVFVLYEIEELSLPEIASATGVPLGTATSRLRRARQSFQEVVRRRTAVENRIRGGAK